VNERRLEARTGEWTTFATQRQDRTYLPAPDRCPLCPSVPGQDPTEIPFESFQIAVFDNRFPAFVADPPPVGTVGLRTQRTAPAAGAAEVVVYSPDHARQLGDMPAERIARIVDVWSDRYDALHLREDVGYVFIFENRGVEMGVTLHHPHGQIYGFPDIPPRAHLELETARAHRRATGRCIECDVVAAERAAGERMIVQNDSFVAFVPFAARFPYEVHIVARRHAPSLLDLTTPERAALAEVLRWVLRGYDALFGFPMPYVMSMHQAPGDVELMEASHLHLEYTPPYRSATRLKVLAGAEIGAGAFVNDTAPERTADELRRAVRAAEP
jgi:UDPglucose--hexose-1-phosphate uridylyltransferase